MCGNPWICSAAEAPSADGRHVLTNAAQIRALKPEEAARQLPIHLRGVVLLVETNHFSIVQICLTIVDKTAGIYLVAAPDVMGNWRRGDLVEVDGVSDPGKFAPMVRVTKACKVGVAEPTAPQPVTYDELLTGRLDAQWVEVSGVVRRVGPSAEYEQTCELWLATGGGRLAVRLSAEQDAQLLVDSEVRLRGLCFYRFNKTRQALNPVLRVPQDEPVVVRTPAPEESYAVPPRSIARLMQFDPHDSFNHRVRILGVVTYADSRQGCWIQDGEQGLRVYAWHRDRLEVGATVDILGFVTRGGYTPFLDFHHRSEVTTPIDRAALEKQPDYLNYEETTR